ncbi:hypothetical protein HDU98_001457 [Podochytrium sp. JEL0797]|nr:hypothetical protein HDU98_001457 [Podochytrium sp. JEL0797]
MQSISSAELAAHGIPESAYIAVDGKVFDVTDFLDAHPGGRRVLLPLLGKDASREFAQFHNATTVMGKYAHLQVAVLDGFKAPENTNYGPESAQFGTMVAFADPAWYQNWASPYYKESHQRLRAWIRDIVDTQLMPHIYEWDTAGEIPISVYRDMGKAGVLSCMIGVFPWPEWAPTPPPVGIKPEEWDMFHELVVLDEVNRTASSQFLWVTPAIALTAIIHYGSPALKEKLIKPCLLGDKNIALGITEPYAGSDVANIQTTAQLTPDGKHYILNGEKKWITTGNWAEYFVIAARTGGTGMSGISLILVERKTEGFSTRPVPCQGCRGSGTAFLMFENVKVPVANLIGKENQGFAMIMQNFNHERLSGAYGVVRMARVCYEEAFLYAHKRRTFGKILFEHAVIRNKLAHMARQIEATHAWVEFIVYQFSHMSKKEALYKMGGPTALLKAQCSTMLEYCAREASQILGGVAYTKGGLGEKVERIYRDVRGVAIPGGSEEIMLAHGPATSETGHIPSKSHPEDIQVQMESNHGLLSLHTLNLHDRTDNPPTCFTDLPVEIALQILSWVHPEQARKLRRLSKTFSVFLSTPAFACMNVARFIPPRRPVITTTFPTPEEPFYIRAPQHYQTAYIHICLGKLEKLERFDFPFTIPIPIALLDCKNLVYLEFRNCFLIGSIPVEIGELASLEVLHLGENRLQGTMPSSLRRLQ